MKLIYSLFIICTLNFCYIPCGVDSQKNELVEIKRFKY
mgnify:CR=1 FL=1